MLYCRCFEAVQSELVTALQLHCANETRNASTEEETCSANCSVALEAAHTEVGCCLDTVFNESSISQTYPFTQAQLWSKCNQSVSDDCTQCSKASTPVGVLTVLTISIIYSALQ